MNALAPPRRAVFTADPITHSWVVARSRGWPTESAAEEAVWRLDTDGASVAVEDFAGFFSLGAGSWVVVRGCITAPPNPTGRYLREAIAIDDEDFARVRFNPFRLLPEPALPGVELLGDRLPPPQLPSSTSASEDVQRLQRLGERTGGLVSAEHELLLAAVLESEHTLVMGSRWTYEDLELLVLLLPPRARTRLTFHTCATALPTDPVPRLVLTPKRDDLAFQPSQSWGHRLPATRGGVNARAHRVSKELMALLATPDRFLEAHEAFGAQPRWDGGTALLDEMEMLLRLARPTATAKRTEPEDALRALERAAAEILPRPDSADPDGIFRRLPPERIGAALARHLRQPDATYEKPALLMERFFARRQEDAAEFDAFVQPLEGILGEAKLPPDDVNARRIRTMLMLHAAARGDAGGVADALVLPIPRDVIARLGGIAPWLPRGNEPVAQAIRALAMVSTTQAVGDALRALATFARGIEPPPRRQRLAEAGVDFMRWAYRHIPPNRWDASLPIAAAGADLFRAAAAATTVRIRTSFTDAAASGASGARADEEASGPTRTSDSFLGFLGIEGAAGRPVGEDIATRGLQLVEDVAERIRSSSGAGDAASEAVHWSVALLDRVRRGEVEPDYVVPAARLLQVLAASRASAVVRAFIERHPDALPWLFEYPALRQLLEPADHAFIAASALERRMGEAPGPNGVYALAALCQRLARTGVQLGEPDVPRVEKRLRELVRMLADRVDPDEAVARVAMIRGALAPLMTPRALASLEPALELPTDTETPRGEDTGSAELVVTDPAAPTLSETIAGAMARSGKKRATVRGRRRPVLAAITTAGVTLAVAALLWSTGAVERVLAAARFGGVAMQDAPDADLAPSDAASEPVDIGELAEARGWATVDEWSRVIELLSRQRPTSPPPQAFAWDSLLASAALQHARGVGADDTRRRSLLALTYERATRGLAAVSPFAPGADQLRLIRAEACLAGLAGCDADGIIEDLVFAVRSRNRDVSARATEALAAYRR